MSLIDRAKNVVGCTKQGYGRNFPDAVYNEILRGLDTLAAEEQPTIEPPVLCRVMCLCGDAIDVTIEHVRDAAEEALELTSYDAAWVLRDAPLVADRKRLERVARGEEADDGR